MSKYAYFNDCTPFFVEYIDKVTLVTHPVVGFAFDGGQLLDKLSVCFPSSRFQPHNLHRLTPDEVIYDPNIMPII